MMPQGIIPPTSMPPSGPHSLIAPRGPVSSPMGPSRIPSIQPNQPRPMVNVPLPQMHPLQMQPNFNGKLIRRLSVIKKKNGVNNLHLNNNNFFFLGIPLPVQNPTSGPNSLISQTQSLIMPPNGPINVGMGSNVMPNPAMPGSAPLKMNLSPNATQSLPITTGPGANMSMPSAGVTIPNLALQGSQHRVLPGHPINAIPSQNMGLQQGQMPEIQNNQPAVLPQVGSQSSHQQFQQLPPGGEQSHSGSTGELISFD